MYTLYFLYQLRRLSAPKLDVCYLWTHEPKAIGEVVMRSRGPARSCGDGPYFVARKIPDSAVIDGTTLVNFGWVSNYGSGYIAFGYSSAECANIAVISGTGRNIGTGHLDEVTFDHYDAVSNRVYFNYDTYQTSNRTFPTPVTADYSNGREWLLCEQIKERAIRHGRSSISFVAPGGDVRGGDATFNFKNGEYDAFRSIADLGIFPRGYAGSFSAAYMDCVDSLTLTDVNTLANIGQCIDYAHAAIEFLKSPLKGLKKLATALARSGGNIRRTAGSLWLKYRYEYLTSKSDIAEYENLIRRLSTLTKLAGRKIKCDGAFSDDTGSYQCSFRLYADDLLPEDVRDWLEKIGVNPNLENLWDLIPYSFMVDWVIPVSKVLQYFDKLGNEFRYSPEDIWFTYLSEYDNQVVFFRVPGRRLEILPKYKTKQASATTIKMRIADTISLVWR